MPSLGVGVGCLRSADAVVSLAACASALASRLTMWSRLRIIDVSDNRIVSMESIAVLRTMRWVRQLSVHGCPVAELPTFAADVR